MARRLNTKLYCSSCQARRVGSERQQLGRGLLQLPYTYLDTLHWSCQASRRWTTLNRRYKCKHRWCREHFWTRANLGNWRQRNNKSKQSGFLNTAAHLMAAILASARLPCGCCWVICASLKHDLWRAWRQAGQQMPSVQERGHLYGAVCNRVGSAKGESQKRASSLRGSSEPTDKFIDQSEPLHFTTGFSSTLATNKNICSRGGVMIPPSADRE